MQFKIFDNRNLIQRISDSSFGSIKTRKQAIKFLQSLNYKNVNLGKLIWAQQVFSSRVHICQEKDSGKIIKNVDSLISDIPGQILTIITADCVPILLYDARQKIVAALHGGRECLVKGIIQNTIGEMIVNFETCPKDILVGIGPHIRVCHYWLKEKTYQNLKNTEFKKYFLKRKNKVYFDLTKLTLEELFKAGIKKKNIEDCQICTYCSYKPRSRKKFSLWGKKYFSARKEEEFPKIYKEKNPRFISFIGIY